MLARLYYKLLATKVENDLYQSGHHHETLEDAHRQYKIAFGRGLLEGAAFGAVLGFFTGGIGFLAIPILAFFQGVYKFNNLRSSVESVGVVSQPVLKPSVWDTLKQPLWNTLKGTGVGCAYGAAIGLLFAGFTFGASIPICAAIGAFCGLATTCLNECFILKKKSSNNTMEDSSLGLLGGIAGGLALIAAPFTGGLSLLWSAMTVAGGAVMGAVAGAFGSKVFGKIPKENQNSTYIATTVGVVTGVGGGALIGATKGAALGAMLAPITFGISIPVGALIGALLGGCVGGTILGALVRCCGYLFKERSVVEKTHSPDTCSKFGVGSSYVECFRKLEVTRGYQPNHDVTDPAVAVDSISVDSANDSRNVYESDYVPKFPR